MIDAVTIPQPREAPGTVKVWRCIGCGRIEMPAPCVGVCEDRVLELVDAATYESLRADYLELRELAVRLAGTHPRDGQWEQGYRALQERARDLLACQQRR